MCNKHITSLNKLASKPKRPVQTVIPEPAVPRQPQIGAPQPSKAVLKKASTIPKMSSPLDNDQNPSFVQHEEKSVLPETDEVNKIKTK
ncbi:hypothetical protein KSI60_24765, partial [Salmonella enterica subsp. enterica serovar Indiana]|nr:hypothetical protein [Salmonella enterica subsp. enterica serovar Indiana]